MSGHSFILGGAPLSCDAASRSGQKQRAAWGTRTSLSRRTRQGGQWTFVDLGIGPTSDAMRVSYDGTRLTQVADGKVVEVRKLKETGKAGRYTQPLQSCHLAGKNSKLRKVSNGQAAAPSVFGHRT